MKSLEIVLLQSLLDFRFKNNDLFAIQLAHLDFCLIILLLLLSWAYIISVFFTT